MAGFCDQFEDFPPPALSRAASRPGTGVFGISFAEIPGGMGSKGLCKAGVTKKARLGKARRLLIVPFKN